mmetsp:Transcript_2414/g.4093  ORF Transcript_2414/g.4093 Transcript_2414/m.4093 type:complete len:230 (+) Transcript_2414:493-1182(+)
MAGPRMPAFTSSPWEPPVTSSRRVILTRMSLRTIRGRLPTTILPSCPRASTSPHPSPRTRSAASSTFGTMPSPPRIPMPSPSATPRRVSSSPLSRMFPVPTTIPSRIISSTSSRRSPRASFWSPTSWSVPTGARMPVFTSSTSSVTRSRPGTVSSTSSRTVSGRSRITTLPSCPRLSSPAVPPRVRRSRNPLRTMRSALSSSSGTVPLPPRILTLLPSVIPRPPAFSQL